MDGILCRSLLLSTTVFKTSCVLHCSPKFVVTMNQVDDKYKTDTEKEATLNEATDDGE